MPETIEVSTILPVAPDVIYKAWLDSAQHSLFTGSPAEINPIPGGLFTAWDGYISGVTLEMTPFKRILQSWRAEDFPEDAANSELEIRLEAIPDGTYLTLTHTDLPDGQGEEFKQGWLDYYFAPMHAYFSNPTD